ncbi:hypothetical protein LBMAG42_16330 [Deltaproteobacteria bacterium]|nr:hypothetical protein LBMAG42_16330 [Deltaproteobacteria bacterium]
MALGLSACALAAFNVALAADSPAPVEAEPVVIAIANLKAGNTEARAAAEAIAAKHPDLVLLTECSRVSLAEATFASNGLQLVLDGRDPSPWGICVAARVEGDVALIPAAWKGPCVGPMVVGRFELGRGPVALIGVHLPPRVPNCEATTDAAVAALAVLVSNGRLVADLGPAKAGDAVILAGDLNSYDKKLAPLRVAGLADTGEIEGVKLTTWQVGPIKLWLDHVLIPKSWPAEGTRVFEVPGSDHAGLVTTISPE